MKSRLTTYKVSGSRRRCIGQNLGFCGARHARLARLIQVDEESRIHILLGERRNDIRRCLAALAPHMIQIGMWVAPQRHR